MNPYTAHLLDQLDHPNLAAFVEAWDTLEGLVIRTYKDGKVTPEDAAEHGQLRQRLQAAYPQWQERLEPYWRLAKVAGEPAREDPFLFLLAVSQAAGFVQNWAAMQTLPAAREAVNQLLIEVIVSGK